MMITIIMIVINNSGSESVGPPAELSIPHSGRARHRGQPAHQMCFCVLSGSVIPRSGSTTRLESAPRSGAHSPGECS